MTIPVSACCILATPGVDPIEWQTGFYWKELTDATPDENKAMVVKEFIELDVDKEGRDIGEFNTDVLLTSVHPGHIDRCDGIDFAGVMKLNQSREIRKHVIEQTYTICGMVLETGRCYSGLWVASSPLLAATEVWDFFQSDDLTLLISCVHVRIVPLAEWSATYADPTCATEEAMQSRLAELDYDPEDD